jgi:hypothetical protein
MKNFPAYFCHLNYDLTTLIFRVQVRDAGGVGGTGIFELNKCIH